MSLPLAVQRLVLRGAPGAELDRLIYDAIGAGLSLTFAAPGMYRVNGSSEAIDALRVHAALTGAYFVEPEPAPVGAVNLSARMTYARPFARTTAVATDQPGVVARAVDAGLTVTPEGAGAFAVTGLSSVQMRWMATALSRPESDVLAMWNVTPATIAAEDQAALTAHVSIAAMPNRETVTAVQERDDDGAPVTYTQTQRTVQ